MRLDVRVEEGKGRVPSEIGTEPDRVGISPDFRFRRGTVPTGFKGIAYHV